MTDETTETQRDQFRSKRGFILASIGSAVGMGNIWRFPAMVSLWGGLTFIIPYLIFVVLITATGVIAEFALGRAARAGPSGAFGMCTELRWGNRKLGERIGLIPVVGSLALAIGYTCVMAWITKYMVMAFTGDLSDMGQDMEAISGMFDKLLDDGAIEERNGEYWAVKQEYAKYEIDTSGGTDTDSTGNFIVSASGTLTLRYFEFKIAEDGKTTYYLLGSLDDWRALQSNEKGTADYNTLDYRLTSNIDFGGERAMLAWRTAEDNVLDFTGTLDGGEYVLSNIFEFNEGTSAKSALIESIGEGGVVKNLTVVDSVFDAFGDNTVTAGIAIDNHGTIENCKFEGTLAGGSKTAGAATLAGLVANNFGSITGGVAVADALIFAGKDGTTDAVGIAFNEGDTASVADSAAVAAIRAYGGASGTLGGAVDGDNAGTGNGYVQGLATRNGAAVADGDTSSDGTLVWKNNASIKSVIERYVFNAELISYGDSGLDTDNFRKLIAALRLFEFIGTADVTNVSVTAWGKYAAWLAAHTLN